MVLTLLDFKKSYIEEVLLDLEGREPYEDAHRILTKVRDYTERDLRSEYGSVSVLVSVLAEYLRGDVQFASDGTLLYFRELREAVQSQLSPELSPYHLLLYVDMIKNIDRITNYDTGFRNVEQATFV